MALAKHIQTRYQEISPHLATIWFWLLCIIIIIHTILLHIIGLHAPTTPLIQLLRPLVTCGAAALLIGSSHHEHGAQQWSRLCLAIGMLCSALFSTLKIVFDASIEMPAMRLLWVCIYLFYILGIVLYLRQRLLYPGNALLVFHGSTTVGIATLILLHSTLPNLISWPWNAQVTAQLPSISFDISSLFLFTFLRMRFGRQLSFFLMMAYHGCLILAEIMLTVIVWANWNIFQGVAAPTYPLYALQSVLFAFAIYRDSQMEIPTQIKNERIMWEDMFIWVVVPGLVISALFAASIGKNVPTWLLAALFVSGILYLVLCLNDYWRITQNIYLASLAHLNAALKGQQTPDD